MNESLHIPADMNNAAMAEKMNAEACVSIRDMLVLLGASDEKLRQWDIDQAEMREILEREPWRERGFRPIGPKMANGMQLGFCEPHDWTGTRFEK